MTAVEFIEPLSREDGVSRATKLFVDMYATAPEGVWAAPGRVNLILSLIHISEPTRP